MESSFSCLKDLQDHMKTLERMKLVIVAVFVVIFSVLLFQGYRSDQREDLQYIKNSLSNFYRDFSPDFLTDLKSAGDLVERLKSARSSVGKAERIADLDRIAKEKIKILKNYESDKTGQVDLALYDAGARIAGIKNTKTFYSCNFFWKLIGCPNKRQGPENLLKPCMHLGSCFRFQGHNATVFIRLICPAFLNAVTIEHITPDMSLNHEVTSAPRSFSVSVNIPVLSRRTSNKSGWGRKRLIRKNKRERE